MVTGAGTGVGRRVSEVLSNDGIVVYLIGRRKDNRNSKIMLRSN